MSHDWISDIRPLMRKAILLVPLLLFIVFSLSAQSTKRERAPAKKLDIDTKSENRCGVWQSPREVFLELDVKWRVAAASKQEMYFYNTDRIKCDSSGILSAWVKGTYDADGKSISTMSRYELKCRANQLRVTSQTEYRRDGTVASSRSYKRAEWDEAIPDSVGEGVLRTVCHKSP
jgi:hypothetical protein